MNEVKTYTTNDGENLIEVRTEETPTYTTYTRGYREPLYVGDDFNEAAKSIEMGEDTFNDLLMSDGGDIMQDEEYQAAEERAYRLQYED